MNFPWFSLRKIPGKLSKNFIKKDNTHKGQPVMKILIILSSTAIKTRPSRNCQLKVEVSNKNQPFLIVFGIVLAVRLLF